MSELLTTDILPPEARALPAQPLRGWTSALVLMLATSQLAGQIAGDAVHAQAAQPELIADLRTSPRPDGSQPAFAPGIPTIYRGGVALADRALYFAATDDRHGRELWQVVPGEMPRRLTDLCPGPCDSLTDFEDPLVGRLPDGKVVFRARDGETGLHLWSTDGTEGGTVRLTPLSQPSPHYPPGTAPDSELPSIAMAPLGGWIYFVFGPEMWRTDGTPAGTQLVEGLPLWPSRLVRVGERLLFVAGQFGEDGLWSTEGTAAGTIQLAPSPSRFGVAGLDGDADGAVATLVFAAPDDSARPFVWATEGTPDSTRQLAAICPDACAVHDFRFSPADDRLAFWVDRSEVWHTDGTPEGTQQVAVFDLGRRVEHLAGANGAVLAVTRRNGQDELWRLATGGPLPTAPVLLRDDVHVFLGAAAPAGPFVFYGTQAGLGAEPWASDGTAAGTVLLADLATGPASSTPRDFEPADDALLYFTANDGSIGRELYATDGTPAGTERVADLRGEAGEGSNPADFVGLGDDVLFVADAVTPAQTFPLVSSEDYRPTTDLFALRDRQTGLPQILQLLGGRNVHDLRRVGDRAVFAARNLPPQDFDRSLDHEPWITDGTVAGTRLLVEIEPGTHSSYPRDAVAIPTADGERILFFADRGNGAKIWLSDGTQAGTQLVADIYPGWDNVHPDEACPALCSPPYPATRIYPRQAVRLGDLVVFIGRDPDVGEELWVTDGTGAGTGVVADLAPGPAHANPEGLVASGGLLYFTIGPNSSDHDFPVRDLWATDGTAAGTRELAADLGATLGMVPIDLPGGPGVALLTRGDLDRDLLGTSLWISDGTSEGTERIGSFEGLTGQLTAAGSLVYFTWDKAGQGTELARSDGTEDGTWVVGDLRPGERGSAPTLLASRGGEVVFAATDGSRPDGGTELWISDGSLDDARRLSADVTLQAPDAAVFDARGRLLVAAEDGVHGRELWRLDDVVRPGPCRTDSIHHCLAGRFRLRVDWRVPGTGTTGSGVPLAGTEDTGYFWFFGPDNVELAVKVLDGRSTNGHHWLFFGALTDVDYTIHAEDTLTGVRRVYSSSAGTLCGRADVEAFPEPASATPLATPTRPQPLPRDGGSCGETGHLCLQDRFDVAVTWQTDDAAGHGEPIPFSDQTGMFWFFDADNVELLVKVLDGRPINGRYWAFYGALSDVEYQIHVVDTESGATRTYNNPRGELCGGADVDAFDP